MSPAVFLHGFGLCFGLIAALGPQNLHVLRTGLARQHVGATVALCIAADLLLIWAGLAGVAELAAGQPGWVAVARVAAAVFLLACAARAARDAWLGVLPGVGEAGRRSCRRALLAAAVVTFGNPSAYLETLLLLGASGAQHPDAGRWVFGLGAVCASTLWFTGLGYGARLGGPWLTRPAVWRALGVFNTVVLTALALHLLTGFQTEPFQQAFL